MHPEIEKRLQQWRAWRDSIKVGDKVFVLTRDTTYSTVVVKITSYLHKGSPARILETNSGSANSGLPTNEWEMYPSAEDAKYGSLVDKIIQAEEKLQQLRKEASSQQDVYETLLATFSARVG